VVADQLTYDAGLSGAKRGRPTDDRLLSRRLWAGIDEARFARIGA
jgi:hypothetical protein